MSTLYIKTFGCQMNEYDSDKMADVLHAEHGLTQTDTPDGADVVLLNTCSVRDKAQEKTFHDLGRLRELKLKNPNMILGVGGCVASQEGAAILKRAPYVDVIFGPQRLSGRRVGGNRPRLAIRATWQRASTEILAHARRPVALQP